MTVFLCFDRLAEHFGPGKLALALADGLCRSGHRVAVFVEEPVEADNQYLAAFRGAGAEVSTPGWLAASAARWLRLETVLLVALLPVRLPLALADLMVRRRGLARAWRGARGRLNGYLPALALGRPLRWALSARLSRAHRRRRADVLHMLTGLGGGFAWAVRHDVPLLYTENIVPTSAYGVEWWTDVRRHAADVRLIVAVCAAAEPAIRSFLGYRGRIAVAPSLLADPHPDGDKPPPRAPAMAAPCVLGTAARLSPVKGIDVLLRALRRLFDRADGRALELWVTGDGPQRAALEALVEELGLAAHVRFLGHCGPEEMSRFWRAVDIFVLPSRWEGLPLVILEAMAHGKPVVATAVDGVPEAVVHRETGLLVPAGEVAPLVDALAALIDERATRDALGRAGRARFVAHLSAAVTFERWLTAYRMVVPNCPP